MTRGGRFIAPEKGRQEIFVHISAFDRDLPRKTKAGDTIYYSPKRMNLPVNVLALGFNQKTRTSIQMLKWRLSLTCYDNETFSHNRAARSSRTCYCPLRFRNSGGRSLCFKSYGPLLVVHQGPRKERKIARPPGQLLPLSWGY